MLQYVTKDLQVCESIAPAHLQQRCPARLMHTPLLPTSYPQHQGQGQAAIDVLRSGLSMVPDPAAGYDSGRLHMALSEAFVAEHDWVS